MSETYHVVVTGKLVPGFDLAQVKANVVKAFKLNQTQLDKIFSGRPIAVQRGISKLKADKIRAMMIKAGAQVVLKSDGADTATKTSPAQAPVTKAPHCSAEAASQVASPVHQAAVKPAEDQSSAPDDLVCPRCGHEQPFAKACSLCKMDLTLHIQRLKRREQIREVRRCRLAGATNV